MTGNKLSFLSLSSWLLPLYRNHDPVPARAPAPRPRFTVRRPSLYSSNALAGPLCIFPMLPAFITNMSLINGHYYDCHSHHGYNPQNIMRYQNHEKNKSPENIITVSNSFARTLGDVTDCPNLLQSIDFTCFLLLQLL